MAHVVKAALKRAFAFSSVVILAFAMLVSGLGSSVLAYADVDDTQNVWVGNDDVRGDQYLPEEKAAIQSGHVDAFYSFQTSANSDLLMGLSYGNVIYSPKNVTMTISDSSFYTSNLPYKNAGDIPFNTSDGYWRLNGSGNKQSSEVFPGWDSSNSRFSVGAKDTSDACADIVIDKVIGPEGGRVLAWTQKTNDNNETFASSLEAHDKDDESVSGSRFVMPGIIHQSMVGHEHADWVFTKPGTYKISAYTIVKNKKTGKTVTSKHATYTFEVKANKTHAVSSKTETLQMDPNRVPPTKDPKFVEESLSGSTHCKDDDSNICIVGVRNTGSHPHYHSYEPGGEVTLSVYLPKSIRGKKDTMPSWTYIREDEKGPDFSYDFKSNLPVGDRDPDLKETFSIPAEPALNGMLVNATISGGLELGLGFGDDRDTVKIVVDDHGADGRPVVAAIGKMKPLEVGDTLKLKSVLYSPRVSVLKDKKQDPDVQVTSIVKRHVWLIKKDGETKFKYIPKEEGKTLNLKIDKSMDGAIIRSSLVLENGELYRNEEFNDFTDYQIFLKNSEKENNHEDNHENQQENPDEHSHNKKRNRKKYNKKNNRNRKNNKRKHKGDNNLDELDYEDEDFDNDFNLNNQNNRNNRNSQNNQNKSNHFSNNPVQLISSNNGNNSNRFFKGFGKNLKCKKTLASLVNRSYKKSHKNKKKKVVSLESYKHSKHKNSKSHKRSGDDFADSDESQSGSNNSSDSDEYESSSEDSDSYGSNGDTESHATKFIAVATGTASVGLCTITGLGMYLIRTKMKVL